MRNTRRQAIKTIGQSAALAIGAGIPITIKAEEKMPEESAKEKESPFKYFIGVVGNPSAPENEWSDEQMRKIKSLGVNMLQLSIAWANKPADEVLNLEDMNEEQKQKFHYRIGQAKKFGFDTIAHFGVPRILNASPVRPACIMDPQVTDRYTELLGNFMTEFPEVEHIMLYTYDQRAWLCSEYGPCPRCSGIPLHERLPPFLEKLKTAMQARNLSARLWWKPWELTKGQTQMIVANISARNFGLILNPSTSNEVYPFNDRSFKSDLGVKRLVQMAADRDIPVIGEFDHTFYKGLYIIDDYFPRTVYEQVQGWKELKGVTGIKEYYGFATSQFSVNAAMLELCVKNPEASCDDLLKKLASKYGQKSAPLMVDAWEKTAQAIEAFPWDTTYLIGPMGLAKENDGSHSWEPASIPNSTWDTPIWHCNRRGNFMLTQEHKAHPWLFEDAGLRLQDAAELYAAAAVLFDNAAKSATAHREEINMQREHVTRVARALRGTALHFLETLTAHDARMVRYDQQQYDKVLKRLESLLTSDAENQGNREGIMNVIGEFKNDPDSWLGKYLHPRTYESICTIDWSRWTTYQT